MDPQQLIDFVRRQLVQGKTREEIEWTLRLNRASDKEVAIAFNAAEWQKNQNLPIPVARPQSNHNLIWLTILLLLILIIIAAATFLVLFRPELAEQLTNQFFKLFDY
ncbi:MAG: hypothetical protein AAB364_02290 [Patescibacteria group bacterium]|mgnify:CR=1 FL=1